MAITTFPDRAVDDGNIVLTRIILQVSSSTTFIGESCRINPPTSEPVWRISKTVRVGNTTTEYLLSNSFKYAWDDRELLYNFDLDPSSLNNVYSLSFDGVDDRVSFSDNHNFDNATQFTLSMYVRPNNLGAQRCIWSKASDDANVFGWGLYITTGGKLLVQMRASGQLRQYTTTDTGFSALNYTHMVMTYDGGSNINGVRVYFNGVADSIPPTSGPVTNTLLTTEPSYFGRRGTSFYFSGHMDECSFWNIRLNASEVLELYNNGAPLNLSSHSRFGNLLHHYRMGDSDIPTTVFDNQGSTDGTIVGGGTFSTVVP